MYVWYLTQLPTAISGWYQAHDVIFTNNLAGITRKIANTVGRNIFTCPAHARPVDGDVFTGLQDCFKTARVNLSDFRRRHTAITTEFFQRFTVCFWTAPTMTMLVGHKPRQYCLFCCFLRFTINSQTHAPTAIHDLFAIALDQGRTCHLCQIRHVHIKLFLIQVDTDRGVDGFVVLRLSDITKLMHTADNPVAAGERTTRIGDRIVFRRGFWQTCKHSHLGHRQVIK